jgi:hypothetical protein
MHDDGARIGRGERSNAAIRILAENRIPRVHNGVIGKDDVARRQRLPVREANVGP